MDTLKMLRRGDPCLLYRIGNISFGEGSVPQQHCLLYVANRREIIIFVVFESLNITFCLDTPIYITLLLMVYLLLRAWLSLLVQVIVTLLHGTGIAFRVCWGGPGAPIKNQLLRFQYDWFL